MLRIFVFTAGTPDARQHLADSIQNCIEKETVFDSFAEPLHEELMRISEDGRGFYAWGAVPGPVNQRTWEAMDRGDYVLCVYDNTYRYVARVLAKYDNPQFAEAVWGYDDDGRTWKYMYFLTRPMEVDRYVSEFENHLHKSYRGFTRISDERLEAIAEEYESVEQFINLLLDYHDGDGIPEQFFIATAHSEEVAETSLEIDQIAHGEVDHLIPDIEGRKIIRQHVTYERSARNRALAIEKHGTSCKVCGFNFDKVYGSEYADSYIEIHHLKPLAKYEGEVDPATDLVPLCANCHRMAHRRRTAVTSIEELRPIIENANG